MIARNEVLWGINTDRDLVLKHKSSDLDKVSDCSELMVFRVANRLRTSKADRVIGHLHVVPAADRDDESRF